MSCDPEDKGSYPPRTKRGDPAGPDAWFPNVPHRKHDDGCIISHATYSCSCGMMAKAMAAGDFVRYSVKLGPPKDPIEFPMEEFLAGLAMRTAAVDMMSFNKRA